MRHLLFIPPAAAGCFTASKLFVEQFSPPHHAEMLRLTTVDNSTPCDDDGLRSVRMEVVLANRRDDKIVLGKFVITRFLTKPSACLETKLIFFMLPGVCSSYWVVAAVVWCSTISEPLSNGQRSFSESFSNGQ